MPKDEKPNKLHPDLPPAETTPEDKEISRQIKKEKIDKAKDQILVHIPNAKVRQTLAQQLDAAAQDPDSQDRALGEYYASGLQDLMVYVNDAEISAAIKIIIKINQRIAAGEKVSDSEIRAAGQNAWRVANNGKERHPRTMFAIRAAAKSTGANLQETAAGPQKTAPGALAGFVHDYILGMAVNAWRPAKKAAPDGFHALEQQKMNSQPTRVVIAGAAGRESDRRRMAAEDRAKRQNTSTIGHRFKTLGLDQSRTEIADYAITKLTAVLAKHNTKFNG